MWENRTYSWSWDSIGKGDTLRLGLGGHEANDESEGGKVLHDC